MPIWKANITKITLICIFVFHPRRCLKLVRRHKHKPDPGKSKGKVCKAERYTSTCHDGSLLRKLSQEPPRPSFHPFHSYPLRPTVEGDPKFIATSILGHLATHMGDRWEACPCHNACQMCHGKASQRRDSYRLAQPHLSSCLHSGPCQGWRAFTITGQGREGEVGMKDLGR